jgi:drug/metabolite transporter (DMT)-like permease
MNRTINTAVQQRSGVVLVVFSAFVFSSAGIFAKGVPTAAWDVIFWRGVAAASFALTYLGLTGRLRDELHGCGRVEIWLTLLFAIGTAAFISAFKLTSVANVALIYGSAPLLAAFMAWVFLRERPDVQTSLGSVAAFAGVTIIVSGSIGPGRFAGDMLALGMTVMMAGTMVIYRRFPQASATMPTVLSSLILLPVAATFGAPLQVPLAELPPLFLFGLIFAIASVTLSEGARRLPPARTALLSTLEVPLAPLLAFVFLAAVPVVNTVIGGCIILTAVICSQTGRGASRA